MESTLDKTTEHHSTEKMLGSKIEHWPGQNEFPSLY